jgi:two-component system, NtrC family, response regulator HydG
MAPRTRSARSAPEETGFVARSPVMRRLLVEVRRYAQADANVLITGETGAGKDRVAEALHRAGPRRHKPFVKIDCASMPASLMEAELFGFERGAFTDASVAKPGRFEAAGAGTLYLDGVNELPLDLQSKLLRVVEDKKVERLGGVAVLEVQARIVASAGDGLERAVQDGAFRDDLYHRLRVLPLHVAPLRERPGDVLPLARHFLARACSGAGRDSLRLTRAAGAALARYPWPGNVRELKHTMERVAMQTDAARREIEPADLPIEIFDAPEAYFGAGPGDRPTLAELERRYLELVLREQRGNQTETARRLGISRKALWEKRKRFGLD